MLKLPSSVPLDLLFLRIFVCGVLCIFSVLFYAGLARAPPASVGVFLRIILPDFLGSSLSFQCRTLRFPKNRTRAFLLVVARCAASYLWKSFNEAFDGIGKRSVYGILNSVSFELSRCEGTIRYLRNKATPLFFRSEYSKCESVAPR